MTTDAELYDTLKYRIADEFGTRSYYNHAGKLHREEGPAVTYTNGDKSCGLTGIGIVLADQQLSGISA